MREEDTILLAQELSRRIGKTSTGTTTVINNDLNTAYRVFELDLTKAHTNKLIAQFDDSIQINSITVDEATSAFSITLNGIANQAITLSKGSQVSINNFSIKRIYLTNQIGTGITKLYAFGK